MDVNDGNAAVAFQKGPIFKLQCASLLLLLHPIFFFPLNNCVGCLWFFDCQLTETKDHKCLTKEKGGGGTTLIN